MAPDRNMLNLLVPLVALVLVYLCTGSRSGAAESDVATYVKLFGVFPCGQPALPLLAECKVYWNNPLVKG